MAYRDPEEGRARDRERFRQRTAERIAQGLCPRCGKAPPAPERKVCGSCAGKRNRAGPPARPAGTRRGRAPVSATAPAGAPPSASPAGCARSAARRPRARSYLVRALRREAACGRTRPLCGGQGRGQALRWARPEGAAARCARQDQAALRYPPRGRPVHPVRLAPAGRGRHGLRAVPRPETRGRTRAVGRPAGGRPVRHMRGDGTGRRLALRALRRAPGGPAVEERRQPQALRQAAGAQALHRLRPAVPGRGPVSAVRAPLPCALGRVSRPAAVPAELPGHRDRDGRGPRDVREPGRGGGLPGVRAALTPRGRDRFGHPGHGGLVVSGLDLGQAPGAASPPHGGEALVGSKGLAWPLSDVEVV